MKTIEKKILLAVDDSTHSLNAVRYAVTVSTAVKNLTYTLFNIQPGISQFLLEEAHTDSSRQLDLENVRLKHEDSSMKLLDKHKNEMISLGVDSRLIQTVTQPRKLGLAKDIIDYAQQGQYDAIVVGRRGISRVQEAIAGSITSNLLEHSRVVPVWVVDGRIESGRIMIAIDGSESSLRAVDHLGFMLSGNPDVSIILFHIIPRFSDFCPVEIETAGANIEKILIQGDRRCIDHFYPIAMKRFRDAGFTDSQIQIKMVECMYNIGKSIIEEVKTGKYGTLVVGRRGGGKAYYMGSVSRSVLARAENCALWVVS